MNKIIYTFISILIIGLAVYIVWPNEIKKNTDSMPVNSDITENKDTSTGQVSNVETNKENDKTIKTENKIIKNNMHTISIETNKGTIVFETYDMDAPKTVENFITLAKKSYYDGVIFHRVIKGFMIQGGDPTGTGTGGPGYKFNDELNPATDSYKAGYKRGVVAMANAGPNTNGSQFFIMHADYPLPNSYTIFGKVISGIEVVDAIANSQTNGADRPVVDIVMKSVKVSDK